MASTDVVVDEKVDVALMEPHMWKVVFVNDDVTPMDFVVSLLVEVFTQTIEQAISVTAEVHESGSGVAGVYNFDIAESKAVEATNIAREKGYPLQIKITEE